MQINNIILERVSGSKQAGWVAGLERFSDLQHSVATREQLEMEAKIS